MGARMAGLWDWWARMRAGTKAFWWAVRSGSEKALKLAVWKAATLVMTPAV